MKKFVGIFVLIILMIFVSMWIMVSIDKNNMKDLYKEIEENTNIDDVIYVNEYDNNYIVKDGEYLYLFNDQYEEIYKIEIEKIYENKFDYEIIYRNNTIMYMDNYKNKDGVIFKYYDIYTYELIDEIMVGGN